MSKDFLQLGSLSSCNDGIIYLLSIYRLLLLLSEEVVPLLAY